MVKEVLGVADALGLVDLTVGSVDGMFVPGKGGGDDVAHGFKGKGCTLHHMCDNNGRTLALETTAANIDETDIPRALLKFFYLHENCSQKAFPKNSYKIN